jgi:LPPG:FO 2-phospho-L-lactate transferase
VKVALLAGGTGGGKLAAGIEARIGAGLSVIANTGDDIEILGVHVSPDPDLVTYWISGDIDEQRGWGIRDDGFSVFERLVKLGAPEWFALSDRDLAACLYRHSFLAEGGRQTVAQDQIARAVGVKAAVLPMCEQPVRTEVQTPSGWRNVQEYLVLDRAEPEVEGVELRGISSARPTAEVSDAIASADLIMIGPSNPVISIGPILAVPGLREAIMTATAPVVAVSPFVGGKVVKGPTAKFMRAEGHPATAAGVAEIYDGLLDGMVVDVGDPDLPPQGIETLAAPLLMDDGRARKRVARVVLGFGASLARGRR